MKKMGLIMVIIIIIGLFISYVFLNAKSPKQGKINVEKGSEISLNISTAGNSMIKLTSPAFENNKNIPSKYTCNGQNINPPLIISNVPDKAKSLVLIMDDPDAPVGIWTHWILLINDLKVKELTENNQRFTSGITSFGNPGYGGPCPPSGTHHYYFRLYALDIPLPFYKMAPTREDIEAYMKDHIIEKAELIGLYNRR